MIVTSCRRLFAFACGITLLTAGYAAQAADAEKPPTFKVDPFWPKTLPNNWILGQIGGITVDSRGHVWINQRPRSLTKDEASAAQNPPLAKCCIPAPPVIEFDPEGNVVQGWGGDGQGYEWPTQEHGIFVDHKGNVWVGGNGAKDGQVLKFTHDGKFLLQIGKAGGPGGSADTKQLGQVADFYVDAKTNEVYMADGYGNHRIIVLDADTGAFKRMWGAYGNKPVDPPKVAGAPANNGDGGGYDPKAPPSKQFANPVHCVKVSNDGLVYVCDRTNNRVQVFKTDGTFVKEFFYLRDTLRGSVTDVTFWPDAKQTYLITVDFGNNEMRLVRRSDGEILSTYGRQGRNAGQFHWLHDVAVDAQGNVYTGEVGDAKRLQKWLPDAPPKK